MLNLLGMVCTQNKRLFNLVYSHFVLNLYFQALVTAFLGRFVGCLCYTKFHKSHRVKQVVSWGLVVDQNLT